MNTIIVMRKKDMTSNVLPTLLALLRTWSASVSLVLLADEASPRTLSLPAGLAEVIWLERQTATDDAWTALSLAPALIGFSHLLVVEGRELRSLAARLAARQNCNLIADITRILSPDCCQRPVFSDQALLTLRSTGEKHVWTLRHQAFDIASHCDWMTYLVKPYSVEDLGSVVAAEIRYPCITDRPTLAQAEIVVGGGRGVGTAQWGMLTAIADKLGAALGGTRALVDAGLLAAQDQIGQTGEQISPRIYLACGVSGAIQHVAGITGSHIIIAINNDPEAPIIKYYADYYLLGNLAEVFPSLLAKI